MHDISSISATKAARDPLSEILQDMRLAGVSYDRCELRDPWGISFPKQTAARFHFVADGPCWLFTDAKGWQKLPTGVVLLVPHGTAHMLASAPGCYCPLLEGLKVSSFGGIVFRLESGGDGKMTRLFSGSMDFISRALKPLLKKMPEVLGICEQSARDVTMMALLDAMAREVCEERIGGATMLTRLADLVAATVIRNWLEAACEDATGWLKAVRDPQIGRALAAVHLSPGEPWTVEGLAALAGMSRSAFADRFKSEMGEGPARYIANWRMQIACEHLDRDEPIAAIAVSLGYESEASFSRAFKRVIGMPPSQYRRLPAAA